MKVPRLKPIARQAICGCAPPDEVPTLGARHLIYKRICFLPANHPHRDGHRFVRAEFERHDVREVKR